MEKSVGKKVLLTIMGVLILVMIVATVLTVDYNNVTWIFRLLALIFIALYGFWLYKIPHGNFLKYAMLLTALADIVNSAIYLSYGTTFAMFIVRLFVAAGLVYCAGRLDRIEQNKIILPILDGVILINSIIGLIKGYSNGASYGFMLLLRVFTDAIIIATLMIAYFVRYKEHKEAGINK